MPPLTTHAELLTRLQVDGAELRRLVCTRDDFYSRRTIRRRSRSRPRVVYEVRDGLRRVHRVIAMMLREDLARMDDCVTGFRKGRSIKTHASPHCAAKLVAVADISSFFPSITEERVWRLFLRLGASRNVAMTLARLTTLRGSLPEGARSSPAIANLIGQDLDRIVMSEVAGRCSYTRYVDDLAFSGDEVPTKEDVARWIGSAGFTLKPSSYRVRHNSQGPYVTGLFVGGVTPRVPRKRRRMVERALYYMGKEDWDRALLEMREASAWKTRSSKSRRAGLVSMIESIAAIDSQLANTYRSRLREILRDQESLGRQDLTSR
jgi:hypothetical protein